LFKADFKDKTYTEEYEYILNLSASCDTVRNDLKRRRIFFTSQILNGFAHAAEEAVFRPRNRSPLQPFGCWLLFMPVSETVSWCQLGTADK
jgi:hypothetical protein